MLKVGEHLGEWLSEKVPAQARLLSEAMWHGVRSTPRLRPGFGGTAPVAPLPHVRVLAASATGIVSIQLQHVLPASDALSRMESSVQAAVSLTDRASSPTASRAGCSAPDAPPAARSSTFCAICAHHRLDTACTKACAQAQLFSEAMGHGVRSTPRLRPGFGGTAPAHHCRMYACLQPLLLESFLYNCNMYCQPLMHFPGWRAPCRPRCRSPTAHRAPQQVELAVRRRTRRRRRAAALSVPSVRITGWTQHARRLVLKLSWFQRPWGTAFALHRACGLDLEVRRQRTTAACTRACSLCYWNRFYTTATCIASL